MKTSLRSFRKYVPTDVVRALFAAGKDASLGGEHRTVTIYFSDIADFTLTCEQLTPEQIVTQLAEYFADASRLCARFVSSLKARPGGLALLGDRPGSPASAEEMGALFRNACKYGEIGGFRKLLSLL